MKNFNNWNVIIKGWYFVCSSDKIKKNKALSFNICGQKIVFFRGEDGKIRALGAYCPHLGTDLGLGRVDGNWIRCNFHQWAFDETGKCQNIPCQEKIPIKAQLKAYTTAEKYGFIWVYPEEKTDSKLPEFDELKGKELIAQSDKAFTRKCHHHICMMNGIDAQHLKTIHHLDIKMELSLETDESGRQIDFTMKGNFPKTTWRERLAQRFLGDNYQYSMRYADGCMGLLTIMKNVRLFPPLHMIYAYRPIPSFDSTGINLEQSKTLIQPIYITEKRKGIIGFFINYFLLICTRLAYYMLRGEDGQIYDNIQFNPNILLKIDAPLAQYMEFVNQLEFSCWSKKIEN